MLSNMSKFFKLQKSIPNYSNLFKTSSKYFAANEPQITVPLVQIIFLTFKASSRSSRTRCV